MFQSARKFTAIFLFAIFSFVMVSPSFAASSESEKSVTGFFRRLFNYPVKAVQGTGEMTGNLLNNTGEKVIAKTGENTAQVLTGQLDQAPAIVGDAVVGTAQTTGQAVAETGSLPVNSAQEEQK